MYINLNATHSLNIYGARIHTLDKTKLSNIIIKKIRTLSVMAIMCFSASLNAENAVTLDNGEVTRVINCADSHISTTIYKPCKPNPTQGDINFIRNKTREFAISVDDKEYTGLSDWANISHRDTISKDGGKGVIIAFDHPNGDFSIELSYIQYPGLPIVRKNLHITNTGKKELKVENIDVECFETNWWTTETWTLNQYARNKCLERYYGNWNDPLVIVHDHEWGKGIVVGNEAIGVTKRTAVFEDGKNISAGLTHNDQLYGFRRWLSPTEDYTTPWVFTAPYHNKDYAVPLNTFVPDFVRRHMGIRIEEISKKPSFVYNTWFPFGWDLNETLIKELAKAAADCGVEEFVIDDGWQVNINLYEGKEQLHGDWTVNKRKFPNGLRAVFDYIKSLGMKPGLWVTLASVDPSAKVYNEHPEYFIQNKAGEYSSVHMKNSTTRTACMGTDWYDYIKAAILKLVKEYGLEYVKLDLAVVASAYMYDDECSGCYATNHPFHKDRQESYAVIYERCMQLFDELHAEAPELFIDCTFETAGKMQLMDYGIAKHAEGNWLSNIIHKTPVGNLRVRNLAWARTPALPATSLVIGNLCMDNPCHEMDFLSLTGTLPIMLGDPRKLTSNERARYKSWITWLKGLEQRHGYMSFRQDLSGFGEPTEGAWDGFQRINTETKSGGLIGVFRHGAMDSARQIYVNYLDPERTYNIHEGFSGDIIATMTGAELATKGFKATINDLYGGALFECKAI